MRVSDIYYHIRLDDLIKQEEIKNKKLTFLPIHTHYIAPVHSRYILLKWGLMGVVV